MYQIKQVPEDFVVKEISKIKFLDKGSYVCFRLIKKNWNTLDVVKEISRRLRVPVKNIGFAGSKDKKAITEQVISIKNMGRERVERLKIKDVSLEFLGYRNEPITLGELEGNYFEIVIRNLDKVNFDSEDLTIVNYFDKQRFGENNIEVGRNIIKKDFKKACEVLGLEVKKNNYIGALKEIPKRLLKMYVHAYQSYIWNETVKEAVDKGIKIKEVPLIGFGTDLDDFFEIKEVIEKILEKERLKLNDFIIKQIPELSLEGGLRKVFVEVKDFKVLEKGKKKIKVSFTLPKGSYATMVIKEILHI